MQELFDCAQKVEAALRQVPEIQDVNSDLQLKNPEIRVTIDRNRASALGISAGQIELALQTARARSPPSTRPPTTTRSSWRCARTSSAPPMP